jgi:hypothetical protein
LPPNRRSVTPDCSTSGRASSTRPPASWQPRRYRRPCFAGRAPELVDDRGQHAGRCPEYPAAGRHRLCIPPEPMERRAASPAASTSRRRWRGTSPGPWRCLGPGPAGGAAGVRTATARGIDHEVRRPIASPGGPVRRPARTFLCCGWPRAKASKPERCSMQLFRPPFFWWFRGSIDAGAGRELPGDRWSRTPRTESTPPSDQVTTATLRSSIG